MDNRKTMKVANGFVEGQVMNILGRDIVQFLSIPYCKAPVKELRFQRPQPCESFSDKIINKLKFETCPPQPLNDLFDEHIGNESIWIVKERCDEDSLYVNIWCPLEILIGTEKQPVFIFIYGGGNNSGSSSLDIHNGSILSSHENIIVVSFNYRIGILGFLCLDDHITGNLGIWDQVLALKWIYQNISNFNGDQENITLGGYSSGGSCVSLHLLIEESWLYFSKAIMLSGTCLLPPEVLSKAELNHRSTICVNKILRKHEFPFEWRSDLSYQDKTSIITFLQNLHFENFLIDFDFVKGFFQLPWAPSVDGELIKNKPLILFRNGHFKICPIICQNVEHEANRFIYSYFPDIVVEDNKTISLDYLHESLQYYPYFPHLCNDGMMDKIKREYNIQEVTISIDILNKIISDEYFVCGSIELANIVSKFHNDVYYLWFNYPFEHNCWPKWCGVLHGDDIFHLFGNTIKPDSGSTDSEKMASELLMKQYGLFIRNGHLQSGLSNYNETSRKYNSLEKCGWITKVFSEDQFTKVSFWETL